MAKRNSCSMCLAEYAAYAAIAFTMLAWPGVAVAAGRPGCTQASGDLLKSSRSEAWSDYWVEVAKVRNLASPAEIKEAIRTAAEDLREALNEGKDQYDARIDLCSALSENIYNPDIDPADFENGIPNPYFPLVPGTIQLYEGETSEGTESNVTEVTDQTREILGVTCIVVHDSVYLEGELTEDTFDYYAADNLGNIWYFGENTVELEDGLPVNIEGAWIAGEDGAKPGIIMLAAPVIGVTYRQEYQPANAEDAARVLSLTETVTVPFGTFVNCLETADFTPIHPEIVENKFYAPGVGIVKETNPDTGEQTVLVSVTTN